MFKLLIITVIAKSVGADSVNYCDPKLCSSGVKNIACDNDGAFSSSCPADRKLITLSQADIQSIVYNHNTLRNKIASGNQAGFNQAKRMTSMVIYYVFSVALSVLKGI